MDIGLNAYLLLSALLFAIGFSGVLLRRNTLVVLMCLLMKPEVNVTPQSAAVPMAKVSVVKGMRL